MKKGGFFFFHKLLLKEKGIWFVFNLNTREIEILHNIRLRRRKKGYYIKPRKKTIHLN